MGSHMDNVYREQRKDYLLGSYYQSLGKVENW
jgi:hypothetical protein